MADGNNPVPATETVPPVAEDADSVDFEGITVQQLRADLEALLCGAHDCAEALSKQAPSRSLSMVLTKLDEAEMWSLRLDENGREGDV